MAQIADILNRHCVVWSLRISYLMSMRMDRVMTFNDPFNLKIVTDIINSLGASEVSVFHPHSSATTYLIKNYIQCIDWHPNLDEFSSVRWQVCFPDEGAYKRYTDRYDLANKPLVCEKVRDASTGKINSVKVKNPEDYANKPIMVVDDLCDAGGTFCGVADAIRSIDKDAYLGISVIHMVNQNGIKNLSSVYDEVFFTNTYRDWRNLPMKCKMFDVFKEAQKDNG